MSSVVWSPTWKAIESPEAKQDIVSTTGRTKSAMGVNLAELLGASYSLEYLTNADQDILRLIIKIYKGGIDFN
jgi:hypothetical protein